MVTMMMYPDTFADLCSSYYFEDLYLFSFEMLQSRRFAD